jgi:hypothetical protein
MSTPLLLAALTPDGTAGRLQILDPYEEFPAPVGAPAATCQVCRRPIYHRDDGMWTLGVAPWWCSPDNELVGVLAQSHRPPRPPEPAGADQPADDDQATATIYRWYGRHGGRRDVLLYIGQTGGRQRRPLAHRSKQWWPDVRRGTIEHVPAADVLRLERAAIETERPVWNVTWNR